MEGKSNTYQIMTKYFETDLCSNNFLIPSNLAKIYAYKTTETILNYDQVFFLKQVFVAITFNSFSLSQNIHI